LKFGGENMTLAAFLAVCRHQHKCNNIENMAKIICNSIAYLNETNGMNPDPNPIKKNPELHNNETIFNNDENGKGHKITKKVNAASENRNINVIITITLIHGYTYFLL